MFCIQKNTVLIEDFQLPKTFRLHFELFLNSTQTISDGWREIFTISDGRRFYESEIIPLKLFLLPCEYHKPGLFEIKSVNLFGQRYPDTDFQTLINHHQFNHATMKPDQWPSSKKNFFDLKSTEYSNINYN